MLPASYGPYAGQVLGLIDSKTVRARTYGMSDEDFIAWVQKAQTFDIAGSPGKTTQLIPAEWNYYGGMDSKIDMGSSTSATVIGVQTGPGQVCTDSAPDNPATAVIGSSLSYSGHITDVNSEGSPPATQFFIDKLGLQKGTETVPGGGASKGACQWLNFYRNVNLTADGGAGGYVYHVMRKSDAGTILQLPGFEDPKIVGVICRYYLYRSNRGPPSNDQIEALYESKQSNPAILEIVGTFAPLFDDERIVTGPVGPVADLERAPDSHAAGLQQQRQRLHRARSGCPSAERETASLSIFPAHFPDNFQAGSGANPKFDFGPVSLWVANAAEGRASAGSTMPTPIPAIAAGGSSTSIFRPMRRPGGSCRIPMPDSVCNMISTGPSSRRPITISSRTSRAFTPSKGAPATVS